MELKLDGDSLVRIIRECKKAEVKNIKMGEIEVCFEQVKAPDVVTGPEQLELLQVLEQAPIGVPIDEEEEAAEEQEELELAMANPAEWQRRSLDSLSKSRATEGDDDEEA